MYALILAFFLALFTSPVQAAEIGHASASVTSNQTTSSTTFVDVTGATLASGSFTAGKKYLIYITAQVGYTAGDGTEVQVIHGSTAFSGSGQWVSFAADTNRHNYTFMTVWTAVSSEGIALQYRSRTGGANTASANFVHILAMNLSDDVTENTDWFFGEVSADDAMSTSFEDGASITTGAGTWLVLGNIQVDYAAQVTNYVTVRLTDGTNVLPKAIIDVPNGALDEIGFGLARVYTAAGSTTYKVQYAVSASTTANHLHSKIFALNLTKFRNYASAYTEAGTNLSATDYATQIQTLSITPDVQGDVWIGSYWSCDRNSSGNTCEQRIQVDNSDSPAGQTTANYQFRHGVDGSSDEDPMTLSTLVASMTAAAHTVDLDGSISATTSTPDAETATLWAVTMELATSNPSGRLMLMGIGR